MVRQVPGRPCVLVVDDEHSLRELLYLHFDHLGYAVLLARDAAEALRHSDGHSIDVVLTDIVMPGMNGLELSECLRANDPDVPIILMTGTPTPEGRARAAALTAFDYLTKPLDFAALHATVERAVALRRLSALRRRRRDTPLETPAVCLKPRSNGDT